MNDALLNVKIDADTSGLKSGVSSAKALAQNLTTSSNGAVTLSSSIQGMVKPLERAARVNFATTYAGLAKVERIAKNIKLALKPESGTFGEDLGGGIATTVKENAVSTIKTELNNIKTSLLAVWELLKKIALPLATILGAVKSITNAISVAKIADKLENDRKKVGMSATAYQEWGYVLEQNGVEISTLNTAMRTFSKHITDNDGVLTKYSITATNVGDAFDEALMKVMDIKDETEKLTAAIELFGNRATALLPVLNLSSEQAEHMMRTYRLLGGTMNNQLVSASDKLGDSLVALKSAWQGIKNTLAEKLIPVINTVVHNLTKAIAYINIFLKAVLGIKDDFGGADKSTQSIGAGLDKDTDKAKKLKKVLMGFDELNILNNQNETESNDSFEFDASGISAFADIFTTDELNALDEFKEKIQDIAKVIQVALPVLLVGIGAALCFMGNFIAGLSLIGIGITLGIATGGWETLFGSMLEEAQDVCKSLKDVFISIWNFISVDVVSAVKGLWEILSPILEVIWTTLSSLLKDLILPLLADFLEMVADGLNGIVQTIGGVIDFIVGTIKLIAGIFVGFLSGDWSLFCEGINQGLKGIANFFGGIVETILALVRGLVNQVSDFFGGIVITIGATLDKVIEKLFGVKTKIADWFRNLRTWFKDGFKIILNGIIESVEKAINNISNKFNNTGLIRGINKILGTSIALPTISIPRLATGGIVNTPTTAMIGEAGAEAVLPLDRNTEWMDTLADKISQRNAAPTTIQLVCDGRVLGQTAINNINQITKSTGKLQLVLA